MILLDLAYPYTSVNTSPKIYDTGNNITPDGKESEPIEKNLPATVFDISNTPTNIPATGVKYFNSLFAIVSFLIIFI